MTLRNTAHGRDGGPQVGALNGQQQSRHGSAESSGAESYRSDATIRAGSGGGGSFSSGRGTPVRVNTNKRLQYVHLFTCAGGVAWRRSWR
jgi:hypothetical protein